MKHSGHVKNWQPELIQKQVCTGNGLASMVYANLRSTHTERGLGKHLKKESLKQANRTKLAPWFTHQDEAPHFGEKKSTRELCFVLSVNKN